MVIFLSAGIVLYRAPANFLKLLNEGVRDSGPIIIQFPFYAGIMGIMSMSGLSAQFSQLFIQVLTAETLPLWTFLSAGVLNVLIPLGGGQSAVQRPFVMKAAQALGADLSRVVIAVVWGDAWDQPDPTVLGFAHSGNRRSACARHHGVLHDAGCDHRVGGGPWIDADLNPGSCDNRQVRLTNLGSVLQS